MKKCLALVMLAVWLAVPVSAAEGTVEVPETQILLGEDGSFQFTIAVDPGEDYAGAEFGVICSQGVEITSVSASGGSVTGPAKANGLVWVGFFDGADSFSGETSVTVEGTCAADGEGAVSIQSGTLYTVGQQEYTSQTLECGQVVELLWELPETEPSEPNHVEEQDIDVTLPIAAVAICGTGLAALIYYKCKHKKDPKGEQT